MVTSTLCSAALQPGSVGAALPGIEIRLVDESGRAPEGEDPGEIQIRGANLFSGYWPDGAGGPDAEGWWATGDVGFLDAAGDLFLVDRLKELVIVSGFNVYPVEVEEVIARGRRASRRPPSSGWRTRRPARPSSPTSAVSPREPTPDGASGRRRAPLRRAAGPLQAAEPDRGRRRAAAAPSPARCRRVGCAASSAAGRWGCWSEPRMSAPGHPLLPARAATCATTPARSSSRSAPSSARPMPRSTSTTTRALRERFGEEIPVTFVDGRQHDFWRVDPARLRAAPLTAPETPAGPRGAWLISHVLACAAPEPPALGLFSRSQTPTVNEPHGRERAVPRPDPAAHRLETRALTARTSTESARDIPEATVARLPVYLRALTDPRRAGHQHLLQRGARRRGGRQQRQAAQGPLLPRQLRHPRRRLRRGLPALPDRPRDRRDPGLAGGHRRHRKPRSRAGQLLRLPQPRLPRRRAARRRPRPARRGGRRASTSAPSTTSRRSSPSTASPSASSPRRPLAAQDVADRMVAAGITSILNFAPTVLSVPDGRRRAQGRPVHRAADPRLPRAAQDAASREATA